jgi:outer membrane protein TolC
LKSSFSILPFALAVAGLVHGSTSSLNAQAAPARQVIDSVPMVRIDSMLDLPTVVERTLAASPSVRQAGAGLTNARSGERVAGGAYLPSLSVTSSALRSDVVSTTPAPGSPGNSYSAGLASSVDLYTGGRRNAERARSRADLQAAEAIDVAQRYQMTLVAERAFYEVLRGSDLVTVAEARVARAQRGLRYAQDRVRAGTATKSDELRARLELTTGQQQSIAARDTLQTAAYALGRLVGADGPIGARRPASLDPRPLALGDSEIIRLAVGSAPAVQASEAAARAADAATRSAKSAYLPDVRLGGGYNWATQSPILGAVRPGWQLALATSFPLFNGFQREDAVSRSVAAADVSRVTALDATRQVRTDASRLISALRFAERNIALAADAVMAAQEDLRVQTERYRAGIATALDRQSSELAVTQAELGLVAARYNYQVTRATLEALVGRTL